MHDSVRTWIGIQAKDLTPGNVAELGSLDVNGNVRDLVPHENWVGIDLVAGPGVDMVCDAHDVPLPDDCADVVLYLECAEHDSDPNLTLATIARIMKPDGVCFLTTRSEGFPPHHSPDYWRFTHDDIHALAYTACLDVVTIEDDPQYQHPGVFAVLTHHQIGLVLG